MRLLVVEDDQKVAGFIRIGLWQEGYAVDVLHDGRDAGDQVRAIDLAKPFALAELPARLRALLRRGTPRETRVAVVDLELDTVRRTVWCGRAGGPT